MTLTRMEKVELVLIVAATTAAWAGMGSREWAPPLGSLAGWAAGLLFGQGLLRDLVRLALPRPEGEKRRLACLCAESALGLVLLLAAAAVALLGVTQTVALDRTCLALSVACVLGAGFFAKDYVVVVRKEKDHSSVVIW